MKKILLLLVAAFLLACSCSVPVSLVKNTPSPVAVTQPSDDLTLSGLTVLRLHPAGGSLLSQLEAEAPKASGLGQHMFVEFDAEW